MLAIEISCAAIVALYVAIRLRAAGEARGDVAVRLIALSCAAWAGEDSVIRAYGFYGYAPEWSLFVDRVPLLIVMIWPVVIDSAHELARKIVDGSARVAWLGGAIVLADASLIEPIAVHAKLWTWSADEPRALFEVPLVGVAGWAFFAAAAMATFEVRAHARGPAWGDAAAIAVAPLATHAVLALTWWGAFRWIDGVAGAWTPAIAAWCVLAAVAFVARRARARVPRAIVMARAPGAAFFFALLAVTARDRADLVAYALAFAPPYLALLIP